MVLGVALGMMYRRLLKWEISSLSQVHHGQTGFVDFVGPGTSDDLVRLVEKQVASSGMVHDPSPALKV